MNGPARSETPSDEPDYCAPVGARARRTFRGSRNARVLQFTERVDRILATSDPDAFFSCEEAFRSLVSQSFLTDLVRDELAASIADPQYCVGGDANAMNVMQTDHFSLIVKMFRAKEPPHSGTLFSLASDVMVGALGPGQLEADLFEEAPAPRNDVFERGRSLIGKSSLRMVPESVLLLRAGVRIFQPTLQPQTTFALFFSATRSLPFQNGYDPVTLQTTRAIAGDPRFSRLEYAAETLAELGDASSIPAVEELTEHPVHFVRWSALRSLLRLDFSRGVSKLEQAVNDTHPHVRNGARKALEQIKKEG
jgi:hypothetical protein